MISMSRRIIITGASGFIGRALCRHLSGQDYEIIALSRSPEKSRTLLHNGITVAGWDGQGARRGQAARADQTLSPARGVLPGRSGADCRRPERDRGDGSARAIGSEHV